MNSPSPSLAATRAHAICCALNDSLDILSGIGRGLTAISTLLESETLDRKSREKLSGFLDDLREWSGDGKTNITHDVLAVVNDMLSPADDLDALDRKQLGQLFFLLAVKVADVEQAVHDQVTVLKK